MLIIFFFYIDYNHNGTLDYDEILGGILSLGHGPIVEKIKVILISYIFTLISIVY